MTQSDVVVRLSEVGLSCGRIAIATVAGDGTPVLMLHGNSSCKEVFLPLLNFMAASGRAAFAMDLPGHGSSEDAADPQRTYTFPGYADVVKSLADHFAWPRYVLVGWSLGGHIAIETMARDPNRVAGVLVVGTPPGKPSPEAISAAFHTNETMLLAGTRDLSPTQVEVYARALYDGADVPKHLLSALRRTDGRARETMLASAMAGVGSDQYQLVLNPPAPLAIAAGGDDPFVRLEYLLALPQSRIWRGRVHVFEGAGHAPLLGEKSADFSRLVTAFLDEGVQAA